MTDPNETFRTLHRHAGFLRRLARSLVRDPNVADDLEQQTWYAALERPPHRTSKPREWLATVARNFLRSDERSKVRRQRREKTAARPERLVASPSERLEREELLRQVLDSVLSLEEPYRETLLLRFYEGLSPREIAKRQGIRLETVRTRLRRGLSLVRTELDRRNGGERSTWSIALIAAAGIQPGGLFIPRWKGTKEWAMRHSLEIALTATAATVIGVLTTFPQLLPELGGSEGIDDPRIETSAPESAELTEPSGARANRLQPLAGESASPAASAEPATSTSRARAGGGSSLSTSDDEPAFLVSGRVVTPAGSPAAGIAVRFSAQTDSEWHDREESTTGSDGRFEYSLAALPDRVGLRVQAAAHGFADIAGDWHPPEQSDSLRDLGDLRLQPAGTLVVSCVNAEGFPIEAHWRVETEGLPYISRTIGSNYEWFRVQIASSPRDGSGVARLTGVPVGEARIDFSRGGQRQWQTVQVEPGEQNVEFRYDGPDLSRRITVQVSHSVAPESLHLIGPTTVPAVELDSDTFAFEPVPDGVYTIELNDERYLPARIENASPGYRVYHLRLTRSSGVRLSARNATTGEPIDSVEVRYRRTSRSIMEAGAEGVYRLPTGDHALFVEATGYAETRVPIEALAPGEIRSLTVDLGRAASISGRLLDELGDPIGQGRVVIYRPASIDDSDESEYRPPGIVYSSGQERMRIGVRATVSDEDGYFLFGDLSPGTYIVRSEPYPGTGIALDPIDVGSGESLTNLEIVSLRSASLEGRLVGDPSVFEYLTVWIGPPTVNDREAVRVQSDGSFHIGPLPPGPAKMRLEIPPPQGGMTRLARWPNDRYRDLGELALQPGRNVHDLEVPDDFPAFLTVAVTVDGEPVERLKVILEEKRASRNQYIGTLLTEASGAAPKQPVHAGQYDVLVTPGNQDWAVIEPVEIAPGETRQLDIAVELLEKTLRFVEADTDQPLPWTDVLLMGGPRESSITTCYDQTNGDGEVTLSLPAGIYRACRWGGEQLDWDSAIEVQWDASGPSPTVVRVR